MEIRKQSCFMFLPSPTPNSKRPIKTIAFNVYFSTLTNFNSENITRIKKELYITVYQFRGLSSHSCDISFLAVHLNGGHDIDLTKTQRFTYNTIKEISSTEAEFKYRLSKLSSILWRQRGERTFSIIIKFNSSNSASNGVTICSTGT